MTEETHRYDISDKAWELVAPHLPGQREQWGGIAEDNRKFVNAVFWILRSGLPWRNLPPEYGKWGSVYQRFNRWRVKGIWEKLLELLIDEPEFEWLMVDKRCVGSPGSAEERKGAGRDGGKDSGLKYIWPWMRMVCRSESLLHKLPRRIASIPTAVDGVDSHLGSRVGD